ncbi:MAG TPA: class I SAM-dependent methyltransferase [Vicinamibacterales bacterium]|jgi:tRNA (cmo5U34)-methyltransferase|nr:class I SAM-dependent methyltransferase [Vicinamibacterales bacterium]
MSVAAHLGIDLADYDARIRMFIPDYEAMLAAAAAVIPERARTIVDLGTGTGALAAACLRRAPHARIVGIDADADMLPLAEKRLGKSATFINESFLRAKLPACDAVVASIALHHVRTRAAKTALYRRIRAALRPRGVFVSVDCHPATARTVARAQRDAWLAHLRLSYTPPEADALLAAWAKEDVYVPLDAEIDLLRRSGFAVEVIWRKGSFAVLCGTA